MDQPNEPKSDAINESNDILDITTENSPGPALVSNTSLDVPSLPPLMPTSEPATIYFERDSLDATEEPRGDSNGAVDERAREAVDDGDKENGKLGVSHRELVLTQITTKRNILR